MAAAPIVFFDIAGPDLEKQRAFFRDVFEWESARRGMCRRRCRRGSWAGSCGRTGGRAALFRRAGCDGEPGEVAAAGGTVAVPRFEVKGVVVLGLFNDPAGNRLGLVEMDGDKPRIP